MSNIKKLFTTPLTQLMLIALASFLIYMFAFFLPINLLERYDEPRLDLRLLLYEGTPTANRLMLAWVAVWGLYLLGYRISFQLRERSAWVILWFSTFAYIFLFLLMAPFDAADIYDNIMHGRILGIYADNPFQQVINQYPDDPFYEYAAWKQARSAYGPVWETLAGLTAFLAGNGIVANVIAFKILPGIFHIASLAVVILILQKETPTQTFSGAYLLAWNPMMLYATWGNGHNDVAMAFCILLAAWLLLNHKYTWAVVALLFGALMKFMPILFIPVVLFLAWKHFSKWQTWLFYSIRTGFISIALICIAYYPFWNGWDSFSVSRRMNMFTTSLPSIVYHQLLQYFSKVDSAQFVSYAALILLFCFTAYQTIKIKKENDFSQTVFNIFIFYLLITCLWFQFWYSVWLICFASLLSKSTRNLTLILSFWVISGQLYFGPKYVPTMFFQPETLLTLEPRFVLGVLGVPWAYALWILLTNRKIKNDKS